jgi:hypothetical protein
MGLNKVSDNKSGYTKLIARIAKIKDSIAFQASIGLFAGVALICLIGWFLWLYFRWEPSVDLSAIQPFLIGVIQIQAGILAIAISFSLLYLQVSVEAYSLRASKLLVTHKSFQRMIRDYLFILVINCSLAIFAIGQPWFIPILAAILGAGLFIASLFVLIKFIRDVAEFITPETMIQEIFRRYPIQKIHAEGFDKLLPKDLYKVTDPKKLEEMRITIPSISGAPDQFGDGMNMLIDISRRMIGQAV